MIMSMTGFGRAKEIVDGYGITIEIKSVNHRYFDFSARTSRNYSFLEEKLKSFIQNSVSRGKVECQVSVDASEREKVKVNLNRPLIDGYLRAFDNLEKLHNVKNDVTASIFLRVNDAFIIEKEEEDEERIYEAVTVVAQLAVNDFLESRKVEGEKLAEDIKQRLDNIFHNLEYVEEHWPVYVENYKEKLANRLKELLNEADVDPQRLLTEAAIFADKTAVAEETIRLRSHLSQLLDLIDSDEAVGRKMDFLIQELNREANTIGSKVQDIDISGRVIDIKADIEKIREQAQNIE